MSAPALEDIVATVFEVQPGEVTDASSTDTIAAWTSMRHLELVVALEDAYHLSFEFREISTARSVGALRAVLAARGVAP